MSRSARGPAVERYASAIAGQTVGRSIMFAWIDRSSAVR